MFFAWTLLLVGVDGLPAPDAVEKPLMITGASLGFEVEAPIGVRREVQSATFRLVKKRVVTTGDLNSAVDGMNRILWKHGIHNACVSIRREVTGESLVLTMCVRRCQVERLI